MKLTKRLIALALILTLLVCLTASAFADEPQYKTTQDFLRDVAEIDGFECEYLGLLEGTNNNYDALLVTYSGELSDYKSRLQLLFSDDLEEVQVYVYNLINFDESRLSEVLDKVNDINAGGTGVKLYIDKSDNSVTAEMYQLLCENDASYLSLMALCFMIGYTDSAYEMLTDYAI